MNAKQKAVQARIESLEQALRMAGEYLENGAHASWHGFQPLFTRKLKEGKAVPPHQDWVRNVFIPRKQSALIEAEAALQRLSEREASWRVT
jgi:hypothetical protein